jgi:fructose-specific component phosphotransferase system IIB-like protein
LATDVLSTQVHTVDTVGVIPDGKNAVRLPDVTLGFALATSAPARAAPSIVEAHSISSP